MADLKVLGPATLNQPITSTGSLNNLKSNAQSKDEQKINKAAHDFESILIGQWLEEAQKSFATVPGGESDTEADPGHDQLQSIAMQSLAQQMTKSGGLGIASMIIKQLRASNTHNLDAPINKDIKAVEVHRSNSGTVKSLK